MSKNKAVKRFAAYMPIAFYGSRNYKSWMEAETKYENQKNFRNFIKYKNTKGGDLKWKSF